MSTDLDALLAAADPLPAAVGRDVTVPPAGVVVALVTEEPPEVRSPRRPLVVRRAGIAVALAAVVAGVFAALPSGSGPGSGTPGAPGRAWAAELVRFAEASPLLLVDAPGWTVDYADEQSEHEGEMRFLHGSGPTTPRSELVTTAGQPIPQAVITDARRHAELNWRPGPLDEWKRDRAASSRTHTSAPVLGTTADVYEYELGGDFAKLPDYHDITALWTDGDRVLELRWAAPSMAAFKDLLASLHRVDAGTWLTAMPASVVKTGDRNAAVTEMLRDVPLPPGFDASQIPGEKLSKDRYQLGATVAGSVACSWLQVWSRARRDGDAAGVRRAIAAMATAKHWPVLQEMKKSGAYPQVLEDYAAAMPKGTWYGRPLEHDADEGLGCSTFGISLGW